MRQSYRCWMVLVSVIMASAGCSPDEEPPPDGADEVLASTLLKKRPERSPAEVAKALELLPHKDYEDLVDLGTCYLLMGRELRAAETYEVAAREADTQPRLVGALHNKATALAYGGRMVEALQTIDLMTHIAPENKEVAWLRYALYKHSGDALGLLVAADHLTGLEPETTGHEVMEPITAIVLLGTVAVVSLTMVSIVALTPPQDRKEVVVPMWEGYTSTIGVVSSGGFESVKSLGRKLAFDNKGGR